MNFIENGRRNEMSKNPCTSGRTPDEIFCPHKDEDKLKNERCDNCQPRIEYCVAEGMLPKEVLMKEAEEEKFISAEKSLIDKGLLVKKKPGPKPKVGREEKKKYKKALYVHLRFPERYEDVYHEIVRIAEVEHRTVIMQIVHFLRQSIDIYNEKKGGSK